MGIRKAWGLETRSDYRLPKTRSDFEEVLLEKKWPGARRAQRKKIVEKPGDSKSVGTADYRLKTADYRLQTAD